MADKRREGERERDEERVRATKEKPIKREREGEEERKTGVSTLCLEARQLPLYQRDNLVPWNSPRIQPSPSVVGR